MPRLIDANALMPKLKFIREAEHQIYGKESRGFASKCITAVEGAPTIEPERKTGKWEQESESLWKDRRSRWKCSACGKHVLIGVYDDPIKAGLMFCPSCGAKMEVEQHGKN